MSAKYRFAKIFTIGEHQVLVTKDYDDEEDGGCFRLILATQMEDVNPTMALGFKLENARDEAFNGYNKEKAAKFLKTMIEDLGS